MTKEKEEYCLECGVKLTDDEVRNGYGVCVTCYFKLIDDANKTAT